MSPDPWDGMPPLQAMIIEVLTSRVRLGEESWPFPARCRRALDALAAQGLVSYERGYQPRTLQARLTADGRRLTLRGHYKAPVTRLLEEALFIRQNGERPPGGNENWSDWDRAAELFLRRQLPGDEETP